jgi:hypothetical protein
MIDITQSGMVITLADETIAFLSPRVLSLLPDYSYTFRLLARTG